MTQGGGTAAKCGLHVVHISTTYNSRSGSARRTHRVLQACVAAGMRVSLLAGRSNDLAEFDRDYQVQVIPALAKPVSPLQDAKALLQLVRALRALQPDVVHTHLAKAGILGRLAARVCSAAAVVHTIHGPSFADGMPLVSRKLFLALERYAARRTDRFVFVGREIMEHYIAAGAARRQHSLLIRTARAAQDLTIAPLSGDAATALRAELCPPAPPAVLLVYVARIVPSKQIQHAIEVVKKLADNGVDVGLAVIGEALVDGEREHLQELRRSVSELGVDNRVWFVGYRRDVIQIMQAADAVLLSSQHEGLPNVAVESLLAATPLFSYPVSGIKELLPEQLIVNGASADALAERIHWWLELDSDRRRELDDTLLTARQQVVQEYRPELMVEKKIQLYRSLCSA